MKRVAAIEAGGTKMVCAVGSSVDDVRGATRVIIPTSTPADTMAAVGAWLRDVSASAPLDAIGVGAFGPLDLHRGRVMATSPKLAWRDFSWRESLQTIIPGVPIGIDTDTNAAAIAEATVGAGRGTDVVLYVTVGTGIGAGAYVNGRPLHGLLHPEFGHVAVPRVDGDDFAGLCPSHGDCLEGLASGPAIAARFGTAESLPQEHEAWRLEARYLAAGLATALYVLSPQRIILGGGLGSAVGLLALVREELTAVTSSYLPLPELGHAIDHYLVAPDLGDAVGVVGAYLLGDAAY